jgi:hypothetical protein
VGGRQDRNALFDETIPRRDAPNRKNAMPDDILAAEREERIQLFRQLFERCREQLGEDDEQTRMLQDLISRMESQPPLTKG